MEKINSAADLQIAISQMELERNIPGQLLKEQFINTIESLTPLNLIKGAINDISTSPFLVDNMIGSAMALITGYLSKVITVGKSDNLFKKFIGTVLQFTVTNLVAQHPEIFKTMGQFIMGQIFNRKEK